MADIVEMPKLGFDMAEGALVKWVKKEKDKVEKGEALAEIETDKATVEVESGYTGIIYKLLAAEGDVLPVGAPIAVIAQEGEEVDLDQIKANVKTTKTTEEKSPDKESVKEAPQEEPAAREQTGEKINTGDALVKENGDADFIKASPLAKRMADEEALPLARIEGSGPGGRIVKRDVEKALEESLPDKPSRRESEQEIISGQDQVIEISKLRAAVGKRMAESRQTIPDFYVTYRYHVGALMQMREDMNRELPEGEQLSVNDLIVRAVALALREFPNLNASLSGDTLTRHGDIHVGSAVAVENGLLTVVVKNADQKPLTTISREMETMVARVKSGKVRVEDIEGSTFTISNLGMFGVEDFVAIINPPEAAILAVGGAQQTPIVQNGQITIGWQMKATLSADHRITDGAEAARFMRHLALFLEQPWRLVL